MSYIWEINRDHLESKRVNFIGPKGAVEANRTRCTIPFRLYDDDGTLFYSGRMSDDCEGHEPLYDFGMPAAGAVRLDMLDMRSKRWERLI